MEVQFLALGDKEITMRIIFMMYVFGLSSFRKSLLDAKKRSSYVRKFSSGAKRTLSNV